MANRSLLLSHDSATPLTSPRERARSVVAAADYDIPILWLSLFTHSDLHGVQVPVLDDHDNAPLHWVPTLHADIGHAMANYVVRRDALRESVPKSLIKHVDEWEALLGTLPGAFVQIDLAETWMTFSGTELIDALTERLDAFDGVCEWSEVVHRVEPTANLHTAEVARFVLRGYGWEAAAPGVG